MKADEGRWDKEDERSSVSSKELGAVEYGDRMLLLPVPDGKDNKEQGKERITKEEHGCEHSISFPSCFKELILYETTTPCDDSDKEEKGMRCILLHELAYTQASDAERFFYPS